MCLYFSRFIYNSGLCKPIVVDVPMGMAYLPPFDHQSDVVDVSVAVDEEGEVTWFMFAEGDLLPYLHLLRSIPWYVNARQSINYLGKT